MSTFNKILDYFKKKWGIESPLQILVIFIVFALTGSSAVYVRKPIFEWLGITPETSIFIKIPLYLVTVLPAYQVLLLFYGTLLGQFNFFWKMELKMLGGFKKLFGGETTPPEPQ